MLKLAILSDWNHNNHGTLDNEQSDLLKKHKLIIYSYPDRDEYYSIENFLELFKYIKSNHEQNVSLEMVNEYEYQNRQFGTVNKSFTNFVKKYKI